MTSDKKVCRDFGEPHCKGEIDERYTLNFDDIGQPPIYFCSSCGPFWNKVADNLVKVLKTRGTEFAETVVEAEKLNKH
jgi:hypothetical protein